MKAGSCWVRSLIVIADKWSARGWKCSCPVVTGHAHVIAGDKCKESSVMREECELPGGSLQGRSRYGGSCHRAGSRLLVRT